VSVLNIFNIPGDDAELAGWSPLHMIWHRNMNRAAFQKFNILLPEYILDPADFSTRSEFLQAHQTMHNNLDALLGVSSYNLTDVDMEDENQRTGWFRAHAELTRQESNAMGVFA
jgi:hypothetical protein